MASITYNGHIYQFVTLKGHWKPLAEVLEEITRPGQHGQAYRRTGRRADPYEMIGIVDCNSMVAARLLYVELTSLQGELVDLVDDYGTPVSNVAVLKVERVSQRPILAAVGGVSASKQAILVVRFVMQLTGVQLV